MQTAELTGAQDLGAVTELLSGAFFEPFGRSTSHQLWSSAMVVVPAMRGLFGIDVDAVAGVIRLRPQLPSNWDHAVVRRLHAGASVVDLRYERRGNGLVVTRVGAGLKLATDVAGARVAADGASILFVFPPVGVSVERGLPLPGSRTAQMKVLGEVRGERSLTLDLEGIGGSVQRLGVRRSVAVRVEGGVLDGDGLRVVFPAGSGYVDRRVTLYW
jgi:hypothetical protein